jgi:phosphoribosyl-AMP cyclohydrolase
MPGLFQSPSSSKAGLEEGTAFTPRFDGAGLIPAIVTDASAGGVLMFAHMNAEALQLTIETKEAHFWSRSRQSLWRKGETSGNRLMVQEILTDCDQDVIWIKALLTGDAACHTGRPSCFYRRVRQGENGAALELIVNGTRA